MLTGDNGILTQATNAREKTTKAEEEEKIKMAVMGSSVDNNGYVDILDETSFKQELANQFGSQSLDVVANGDGSFIITIEDTERKYYVNDDKTVINSDNIVEITTAEELASFRDDVNAGNSYEGKAVLLTSDITLSGEWEPIGYFDKETEDIKHPDIEINKPFKGIFDGGNHKVDNIVITSTENRYQALFGFIVNSTIRNVIIGENCNITGDYSCGVVGNLYGLKGNIYNCINYADTNAAGIVASMSGKHTISNCINYGNVTGSIEASVGGILGGSNGVDWEEFDGYYNEIINCGNYGTIVANRQRGSCGGIAGFIKGDVINCFNKAEITHNNNNGNYAGVGGIVGHSSAGQITNCYNTKNINSRDGSVGGIVGASEGIDTTRKMGIYNCYTLGEVSGNINVGEIVYLIYGPIHPEIVNCYTKNDTFTASNLGDAFEEDTENKNNGYPILYWE